MSLKLRNHKGITGIKIGTTEMLLSQFADDTDIYVTFDKLIINNVLDVLSDIETNIGLQVSYEKTTIGRIGSIANTNAKVYTKRKLKWSSESINTLGIDLNHKNMYKNFDECIAKMKAVSKMWYYRQMTLIGKTLILNSLIASLFVYKMQIVHDIPNGYYEQINECFQDFLWNGKRAKIKLEYLQRPKELGGLGLVNIKEKHRALLIKWVALVKTNSVVYSLANFFLKGLCAEDFVWKLNLCYNDVNELDIENHFWKTVVVEWCKFNYHEPISEENIRKQLIHFNSNIKIGRKCIKPKTTTDRLVTINDICKPNNRMMSAKLISQANIFSPRMWLEYVSIRNAIPVSWEVLLEYPAWEDEHKDRLEIVLCPKPTKRIYKLLINKEDALENSATKWHQILNENFDYEIHKNAFTDIYKVTNVVKLRAFQFRLLHNKIFCNNILYHWKIKSSNICEFCDVKQYITHLLYECKCVKIIWSQFMREYEQFSHELELNFANIVYNKIHPKSKHVINLIVLIIKQYIYRCKCEMKTPTYDNIRLEIERFYSTERYNATVVQQNSKHITKWSPIKPQLCM